MHSASGAQFLGARSPWRLKVFTVATNICGFPVRNMFRVTLLAPEITRWLLAFSKNSASLRLGYICGISNPVPSCELAPLNGFFFVGKIILAHLALCGFPVFITMFTKANYPKGC